MHVAQLKSMYTDIGCTHFKMELIQNQVKGYILDVVDIHCVSEPTHGAHCTHQLQNTKLIRSHAIIGTYCFGLKRILFLCKWTKLLLWFSFELLFCSKFWLEKCHFLYAKRIERWKQKRSILTKMERLCKKNKKLCGETQSDICTPVSSFRVPRDPTLTQYAVTIIIIIIDRKCCNMLCLLETIPSFGGFVANSFRIHIEMKHDIFVALLYYTFKNMTGSLHLQLHLSHCRYCIF